MIHGLFIGDNYPGTTSELRGCVNDANDASAEWKPWCKTSRVLLNSKADRDGVFSAGAKLLKLLEPGDLGIISISGHGTREPSHNGYTEALVFADFELGYDYEWADLLAQRVKGSFLAVFADTCHSGGLPRGNSEYRRPKAISIGRCKTHQRVQHEKVKPLKDVVYFSGCEDHEFSWDGEFEGRPAGVMTHYLLRAWRERSEHGTFRQLFQALAGKRPRGYLPNAKYDQTPVCVGTAKNVSRTFASFIKE